MISALSLRTFEINSLLIKMKYILYRIFFSGNINMKVENDKILQKEEYLSSQETERKLLKRPQTHGDEKHQQN